MALKVENTDYSGQHIITGAGPGDTFDEAYVNFSGYFGSYGPHVFNAAPELLDACEPDRGGPDFLDWVADRMVHVYGERPNTDFVTCLRRRAEKARLAIAKARGEQGKI